MQQATKSATMWPKYIS